MAVHWECGDTAIHHEALPFHADHHESGESQEEWYSYTHWREWLIWKLLVVQFPSSSPRWKITEKNHLEIYSRIKLYCLISGFECIDYGYFQKFIGMEVNAGSMSKTEYRKKMEDLVDEIVKRDVKDHEEYQKLDKAS